MQSANERRCEPVFRSVLRRIEPSLRETEESFSAANSLVERLEAVVPPAVEIRIAGSLAKGTNLAGNNEFDIFLLFPRHYPHHEMTMLGINYARRAFRGMRTESRYAEHPYLQVFSGKFHADIVPAYKIEDISQKGSSVDRSSLHTEYVNSKLDAKGKRDVRLLKRFMKNFGIYGAEVRVEGFSGYLCELLIIKHGSLFELMRAACGWHEPVISLEGHVDAKQARGKFNSPPLVVIDPTDASRNVAAVVAHTSLSRFIFECRRFLATPSEKFFFASRQGRSAAEIARAIRQRETECLLFEFVAPDSVPDTLWPQLKKANTALVKRLRDLDFSVFGHYHWSDGKKCAILIELDRWSLPFVRKALGPSVRFQRDVDSFVAKHATALNLHIEHDRVVAVEKREFTEARDALMHACRSQEGVGLPSALCSGIKKGRLLSGSSIVKREYAEFLSDYFFMKIA